MSTQIRKRSQTSVLFRTLTVLPHVVEESGWSEAKKEKDGPAAVTMKGSENEREPGEKTDAMHQMAKFNSSMLFVGIIVLGNGTDEST